MKKDSPQKTPALEKETLLFTFAILADSHINPEEGVSSSPWDSNRLANARNRFVIHDINRHAPDFVVHLGDLVHPVPALPNYSVAADRFHELFRELESSLYLVPGNHDVGDKPLSWMPAENVTEDYITLFRKHFGEHFYSFDYQVCHFVIINCQIMNSGIESEEAQHIWLENDLAENHGKRIFLFTHYPLYILEPREDSHYDNIDNPARGWLLELIEKHRVEAVFAGHAHNFFYNRHGDTECYVLPSVTFVRHDYSELFRIGPPQEHGRNDLGKFGYFLVRVYKNGHVAHAIRTLGATLDRDQKISTEPPGPCLYHTKENRFAPVGVDLRHPWAEITELPYSGVVDEFYRKKARNDYPLMALWEMGIKKLRVPYHDLLDPVLRQRMAVLKKIGHEFTVFHYGVPQGHLREVLAKNAGILNGLEVILPSDEIPAAMPSLQALKLEVHVSLFLSKLWSSADAEHDGSAFKHFINHGFSMKDTETIQAHFSQDGASAILDGFVLRVERGNSPWEAIHFARRLADSLTVKAQAQVRLAHENPALSENDDLANANRVAETVFVAVTLGDMDVFLDTFIDFDRGYFPRTGLVNRRYNPRTAGLVFRHLHRSLETEYENVSMGEALNIPGGRLCSLKRTGELLVLVLPEKGLNVNAIAADWADAVDAGCGESIDLATGQMTPFNWRRAKSGGADLFEIVRGKKCSVPTLLVLHH